MSLEPVCRLKECTAASVPSLRGLSPLSATFEGCHIRQGP